MGEEDTPIVCAMCGWRFLASVGKCPSCGRSLSATQRAAQRRERPSTAQRVAVAGFIEQALELSEQLRAKGLAPLAEEGERFAATFSGWAVAPPGENERRISVENFFDWARRAFAARGGSTQH